MSEYKDIWDKLEEIGNAVSELESIMDKGFNHDHTALEESFEDRIIELEAKNYSNLTRIEKLEQRLETLEDFTYNQSNDKWEVIEDIEERIDTLVDNLNVRLYKLEKALGNYKTGGITTEYNLRKIEMKLEKKLNSS